MRPIDQFGWDRGQRLLYDYLLPPHATVFDVGGYYGGWTQAILNRGDNPCPECGVFQKPRVYVFEPISEFYHSCVAKFRDYPQVEVLHCGLGNHTREVAMNKDGAASGTGTSGRESETVNIQDIAQFCNDRKIDSIDLISINIEGGEYELLPRMIESDIAKLCKNIQIQFHDYDEQCHTMRDDIQRNLALTHTLSFDYPFVWESWKRK